MNWMGPKQDSESQSGLGKCSVPLTGQQRKRGNERDLSLARPPVRVRPTKAVEQRCRSSVPARRRLPIVIEQATTDRE